MKQIPLIMVAALTGYCQLLPDASATINYATGVGVKEPVLIYKRAPVYSEIARKANWRAIVKVSLIVGLDGRPDYVKIIQAAGLGLDEETFDAVREWRFNPGLKEGVPVPVAAVVEANFRMRDARVTRIEYRTAPGVSVPIATFRAWPLVGESCGKTTISLHIGADGLASDFRVVSAEYDSIARDVVASAKAWRFQPARQNGVPVGTDADLDFECEQWPAQP